MSKLRVSLLSLVVILSGSSLAYGGVNLPWSTTYNCSDWLKYSDPLNCDGIAKKGSWTSSPEGYYEQITSAANYPGGAGGKGQRHWIGDGTNNNSGGVKIDFNSNQKKIWVRWYQRWQSGFSSSWDTFKNVWFEGNDGSRLVFHTGRPSIGGVDLNPPDNSTGVSNVAFGSSFYKNGTSDGSWVCFEVHLDIPNNTWKAWVDGKLVAENYNVNFGGTSSIDYILLPQNTKNVSNGKSMYVDFDDVAISNTGYIGPIGGSGSGSGGGGGSQDTTSPSVAVSSPSQGQTISNNVALTANASDNVSVSGVQFEVDGLNLGSEDTSAPYSVNFDTTSFADGSYVLTAVARDAAGNQTTSAPVTVTINNATTGGGSSGGSGTSGGGSSGTGDETVLFAESFEDSNLAGRGWYDNTAGQILDSTERAPANGSTRSVKFHFSAGATQPDSGSSIRHKFTATDDLYVTYYVKYSNGFLGSGTNSHPHELFLMSDMDSDWNSPNYSYLQVKIEQSALRPRVIFRDDKFVNTSYGTPPLNLTGQTEDRSVSGCNGAQDGYTTDCYQSNGKWYNSKHFIYNSPVITDDTWHKVDVHIKLNTVSGSSTNADGVMQYWLDDVLIFDYQDLVMRTSNQPTIKFNQLGIAPYIGAGSPIDQTIWIDELSVSLVGDSTGGSGGSSTEISSPAGFQIMN